MGIDITWNEGVINEESAIAPSYPSALHART
jgi:hypothetical protein